MGPKTAWEMSNKQHKTPQENAYKAEQNLTTEQNSIKKKYMQASIPFAPAVL